MENRVKKKSAAGKKKSSNPKKMQQTLVIVESPSKATTIKKYLGKNYVVEASYGHLVDLPKSRMAVDVHNHFLPEYITIRGKAKIIKNLLSRAKIAKEVLLATDPDREGEAIAWHLSNALSRVNPNIKRIMFNEITQEAVTKSIASPMEINANLVDSQQARRILDRLVGYSISPLLWKRIKKGLSAGRVQSVVLKWICQREEEIEKFISEEYWELGIGVASGKAEFTMSFDNKAGEKLALHSQSDMDFLLSAFGCSVTTLANCESKNHILHIDSVKKSPRNRKPPLPYTTSTLQQDAATRLGFTTKKTMIIAQQLYEGVSLGKQGMTGLITYMRTDSTRINPAAADLAREYIKNNFAPGSVSNISRETKGKNIQDAHEAIRPSSVLLHPDEIMPFLSKEQFKLYNLIWRRFVASFMSEEEGLQTTILASFQDVVFRASGRIVTFPGFSAVYSFGKSNKKEATLPDVKQGDALHLQKMFPEQKFTEPPSRYTESSIVSKLEATGIGRPSTFAPTIDTIQKRYYVTRTGKTLKPTELGKIVSEEMTKYFSGLLDDSFTSELEKTLDQIEDGEIQWQNVLEGFYKDFHETVVTAENNLEDRRDALTEETGFICEKCARPMLKKIGRFGYFLACSGFPDCRNAKSIPLGKCPKCETGYIVAKKAKKRKSREFYCCDRYPDCDYISYEAPKKEEILGKNS